jgi:hypothetical protein
MNEFEPCPFCGSWEVETKVQDMVPMQGACAHAPSSFQIHWVQCLNCQVAGPVTMGKQEARDKWNTREKRQ